MELNDILVNTEVVKYLFTAFVVLFVTGLNVLAIKYGLAKPLADVFNWVRANHERNAAAIDEPEDPTNIKLEKITHIPAEAWAIILPILENALNTAAEAIPLGEKTEPLPEPTVEELTQ